MKYIKNRKNLILFLLLSLGSLFIYFRYIRYSEERQIELWKDRITNDHKN